MNITLTRREFTRLVELAHMGYWVATSPDYGDTDSHEKRYGDLMKKIYRLAADEDGGCPEYVQPDPDNEGEFVPTERLEDDSPAAHAMDKFTNDTFWEELISRLAERDYEREIARQPPLGLADEEMEDEREQRLEQLEERYRSEFVKNDLGNVVLFFGADRLS